MPWPFLRVIVQAATTYLLSTLVFDVVHVLLHRLGRGEGRLARAVASVHNAHHDFLDHELSLREDRWRDNILFQHLPETGSLVLGTLWLAPRVHPVAAALALGLHVAMFVRRLASRGRDWHHQPLRRVLRPWSSFLVGRDYHALHHVYPDAYHGSALTLIDRVLGTASMLQGRRIGLLGVPPVWMQALAPHLQRRGAVLVPLDAARAAVSGMLETVDVLVLGGGAGDREVEVMEWFRWVHRDAAVVPEVWCLAHSDEACSARPGRGLVSVGRSLHHDRTVLFRQLVLPEGLVDAGALAGLFAWVDRGAQHASAVGAVGAWRAWLHGRLGRGAETPGAFLHRRGLVHPWGNAPGDGDVRASA